MLHSNPPPVRAPGSEFAHSARVQAEETTPISLCGRVAAPPPVARRVDEHTERGCYPRVTCDVADRLESWTLDEIIWDRPRFERPLTRLVELPLDSRRAAIAAVALGTWRAKGSAPALLAALQWAEGESVRPLVQALVRIGGPAVRHALAAFGAAGSPLERRRIGQALIELGLAACDFGHRSDWTGDADRHYVDIVDALHRVLVDPSEAADVRAMAASGLSQLRYDGAWRSIEALHRADILSEARLDSARSLMFGESFDPERGRFDRPMSTDMLR